MTKKIQADAPPQFDYEAEKAVIGSILLLPDVLDDLATMLTEHHFGDPKHGKLYRHMLALHNSGKRVDPKLIMEALRRAKEDWPEATVDLAACAESVFTAANAKYYAELVRDRAVRREIHLAGEQIMSTALTDQSGLEAVNRVEQIAFAIRDKHRCGVERVTSAFELLKSAMDEIDLQAKGKGTARWATGYPALDKLIALRPGEMVVLAGRPSMGKTALGLNIATNVAVNERVLFVSLEMSALQIAHRILASEAQVDTNAMQGHLIPADRSRVVEAAAKLQDLRLSVDDSPSRNVTEIAAVARREKRKNGLALLVVDYLGLVTPEDTRINRQEQVAEITRKLKAIARELNICVLTLAQLNRDNERAGNKVPVLSNLRESGATEQDADVVIFIHRPDYYMTREEAQKENLLGIAQILVKKQRQGPIGTVELLWQPQWTRFVSLAKEEF